jgi:hypothetical protein
MHQALASHLGCPKGQVDDVHVFRVPEVPCTLDEDSGFLSGLETRLDGSITLS